MDLLIFEHDETFVKIDDQISAAVRRLNEFPVSGADGRLAVAKCGADARQKLAGAEGLRNVVVCAEVQGRDLFLLLGSWVDMTMIDVGPAAHILDDVDSIQVGQPQIQKDHVRAAEALIRDRPSFFR